jgi:hypothetical protein
LTTTVNILEVRRRLGRGKWRPPVPHGPDGWTLLSQDRAARIIVTVAPWEDGTEWVHASIAAVGCSPTYEELLELHRAVFRDGYAYQIFVPETEHINIHATALHLWGRVDGKPELPIFGQYGTI